MWVKCSRNCVVLDIEGFLNCVKKFQADAVLPVVVVATLGSCSKCKH